MVFESLFEWREIEQNPWKIIFLVFVLTEIAIFLSYYIFPSSASVVFIAFIVMSLMPVMYNIFTYEEQVDEKEYNDRSFFERHGRILKIYTFLFVGIIMAIIVFSSFVNEEVYKKVFSEQIKVIKNIRSGDLEISSTGNFVNDFGLFTEIFLNNVQVTTLAFVLSFLFGSGALFLISWNASVLGVFSHMMADKNSYYYISHFMNLLSISLHGIPEMLSYFISGIGGTILSIGLIKSNHKYIILRDALNMYIISLIFVIVSSFIEVFVTPYI